MSGTEDRDTRTNQQVTVSTVPMGFGILEFDFSFRPSSMENITFWKDLMGFLLLGGIHHQATFTLVNKRYSQSKHFTSFHVLIAEQMIKQHGAWFKQTAVPHTKLHYIV